MVSRPDTDQLVPRQGPQISNRVVVLLNSVLEDVAVPKGIVSDVVLDADVVGLMHDEASLIGIDDGIIPNDGASDITRHVKMDRLVYIGVGVRGSRAVDVMRRRISRKTKSYQEEANTETMFSASDPRNDLARPAGQSLESLPPPASAPLAACGRR